MERERISESDKSINNDSQKTLEVVVFEQIDKILEEAEKRQWFIDNMNA